MDRGSISGAHCTCMAGLGEVCSHVAAILFKIEACVRLGFNRVSCTSLPCQWNQTFTKKVQAMPLSEINFTKPKKSNFHHVTPRPDSPAGRKPSFAPTASFLEKLKSANKNAVIFTVTDPKPNPPIRNVTFPLKMVDLYKDEYAHLTDDLLSAKCAEITDNMTVTAAQIDALEKASREQSNSWSWFEYRKGRLTASVFYDICHTNLDKPSVTILNKVMQYLPNVHTLATRWGKQNEDTALRDYEALMKQHSTTFQLAKSGLVLDKYDPYLGASPDGCTYCECCGKGLVEVKCPFKYSNLHPCTVSDTTFYLQQHSKEREPDCGATLPRFCPPSLKTSSKHYMQVQGQMEICDVDHCDFVCWTPEGIHVERVQRDRTFFKTAKASLRLYFVNVVLPEILTRQLYNERNSSLNEAVCVCGRPETYDDLIACDSGHCKVEWYHHSCVGLKTVPSGPWVCLTCTQMPVCKRGRK